MIGKVSWGQVVRELEFQTKTSKFIMATVITEHRKILSRPLKLWSKGINVLWTVVTAVDPIFITSNMCAPVSLASVRKTFDISPGQYFPCTPQKGKLKILWAIPRNALSWGKEPWFLPNKTGLLWAECALPTFNWYQWEKQIFHLSNDQTHKITQECTVCWFEQHRRWLQPERKDLPIYVHW